MPSIEDPEEPQKTFVVTDNYVITDKEDRQNERNMDRALRSDERSKDSQARIENAKSVDEYNYATLRKNQRLFTKILKLFFVATVISFIVNGIVLLDYNHLKGGFNTLKGDNKALVGILANNTQTNAHNHGATIKLETQNHKLLCTVAKNDHIAIPKSVGCNDG